MTWIQVSEQDRLAEAGETVEEKTATRVFIVISDTPTDTVAALAASAGGVTIPARGAPHKSDPLRRVRQKGAKCEDNSDRTVFTVTVEYSNKAGEPPPEDPKDRPAVVTWDFQDGREVYLKDNSDPPKLVLNTAGARHDPPRERDAGELVATVRKLIDPDDYDPAVAIAYKDVINSDSFTLEGKVIQPGQAKCKAYTANEAAEENGHPYRQVQWILEFRQTWDDVVQSRGQDEKDPNNAGFLRPVLGSKVDPARAWPDWPLNSAGAKLPGVGDAPAEQTFRPYVWKPFAAFAAVWNS